MADDVATETGPELSVVVPVLDEKDSLEPLHTAIRSSMDGLARPYEILYIDDGSTDGSTEILRRLAAEDPYTRLIVFSRNFGQTAALSAGFDHARGRYIITLDADLQNDPGDIPLLLRTAETGYDIVSGWRKDRKDARRRVFPSRVANALISSICGVPLNDYGCTLKIYRSDVVKSIPLYGDMHRFIPAAASWRGVSVKEVEVSHHPRRYGRSKYNFSRIPKVLLDLLVLKFLVSYMTRPIRLFGSMGILSVGLGFLTGMAVILMKLLQGMNMTGNPLLILCVMLIILGVQFLGMGLLGEINIRTYFEAQGLRIYHVKETVPPAWKTQ